MKINIELTPGVQLNAEFNEKHWQQVLKAREKQGLPCFRSVPVDGPIVGTVLREVDTSKKYTVQRVRRGWLNGWFTEAKLESPVGQIIVVVGNESSINPKIRAGLKVYQGMFTDAPAWFTL